MTPSTSGAPEPRSTDASVAAHLATIGVMDLSDAIETPLTPLTDDGRPRSGLIVRGARAGGSPFLNVLSAATTIGVVLLLLALIGGLGWLGRWGWRRWHQGQIVSADVMALPVGAIVSCSGQHGAGTPDAVRVALAVVAGTSVMPRDPNEIRTIPGARTLYDAAGNRIDVFQPAGASLAVRYAGKTATVRTVSVRLATAAAPCAALAMVGAITGPSRVRADSAGRVWPVDGAIAPAWAGGIVLQLADPSPAGIALVQLDARTP